MMAPAHLRIDPWVWWLRLIGIALCLLLLWSLPLLALADAYRSQAARAEFQRGHPCPATGDRRGPCPGWVVDHVIALACGGPDTPDNMQWQTVDDARKKDLWERFGCSGGTQEKPPYRIRDGPE